MKLFAQHGAAEGEKISEGFERGLLDGVIYSPRDVSLASLKQKLNAVGTASPTAERLLDPQYYAIFLNGTEEARLGYLMEDDYKAYFQPRRRSQLERESQVPPSSSVRIWATGSRTALHRAAMYGHLDRVNGGVKVAQLLAATTIGVTRPAPVIARSRTYATGSQQGRSSAAAPKA